MFTPESFSSVQNHKVGFAFISSINALKGNLYYCSEENFTGRLDLKIQSAPAKSWSLYFEQGDLVWGDGGVHPIRRWHRQLWQQCSKEVIASLETIDQSQYEQYELLTRLLSEEKIQQQNIKAIVTGLTTEILFDLYQQWSQYQYSSTLQIKFNHIPLDEHSLSLSIPLKQVWLQALQDWQAWQQAELEQYCPNHIPCIKDHQALRQQVLPSTYQILTKAMNEAWTLRDLAVKSNKDLFTVAKSLLPYIQQGLVELSETEDLHLPDKTITSQRPFSPKITVEPDSKASLIAYIDDYKVDGQIMERILTQMGYRFLHIQDPIQALPLLLEHKPKLIFLDLVMPIVNGYEACAQIRRISKFKDTPIIILTSNDGIVDRVRAKIVGSTGFLSKPIEFKKVQMVLQKYQDYFMSKN